MAQVYANSITELAELAELAGCCHNLLHPAEISDFHRHDLIGGRLPQLGGSPVAPVPERHRRTRCTRRIGPRRLRVQCRIHGDLGAAGLGAVGVQDDQHLLIEQDPRPSDQLAAPGSYGDDPTANRPGWRYTTRGPG